MIEYAAKFLQLSLFGLYLIPTKEKKVKKFERGLNSRFRIMMSYFNVRDFSQLVDKASIYDAARLSELQRRTTNTQQIDNSRS